MAHVTFTAFALPGFRSACICANSDDARPSVSSARDHPLSDWGASVGSAKRGWTHLAPIMTHLALRLSAFFPVFEIELALPDAMKLVHPRYGPR